MSRQPRPLEERFFEKTIAREDGCIIWTASTTVTGYGLFAINGSKVVAHRVAWFIAHGEWPPPWPTSGLVLDHKCSTKLCVNVDHLQVITHEENMRKPKAKRNPRVRHCKCCPHYLE